MKINLISADPEDSPQGGSKARATRGSSRGLISAAEPQLGASGPALSYSPFISSVQHAVDTLQELLDQNDMK